MAERILVYGVTGSGKSTLAVEIGKRVGVPYHLVDELTWEPNWTPVSPDEQRRRVEDICRTERWILDTAYGQWIDVPMRRVQVIVALDYPRWLSLYRLLRRSFVRAVTRRSICNGNVESFRKLFSPDSIVVWHFRSFSRKRERIRDWEKDRSGPAVVRLTSPRATNEWLSTLRRESATSSATHHPS